MSRFAHPLRIQLRAACLLAWVVAGVPAAFGQGVEDRLRYLVGQVAADGGGAGEARAFLLWQSQQPEVLRGRSFAVFAKAGAPDAAGSYREAGEMRMRTRVAEIEEALAGSPGVVGDVAALEQSVDELFEGLVPGAGLGLATKLSALLLAAREDARVFERLQMLARVQPGVAICLGLGASLPLEGGGQTTYEVRELGAAGVLAVAGRVTVDPRQPLVLPPPGPPVEVPRTDAQGHLNVRLRWGTDAALRRVAVHQYGFNLYRVERAVAEARGFHASPPPAGTLAALVAAGNPAVRRVNVLPVLPPEPLTLAAAADVAGDPETYFLHDDNRRFVEGGEPFEDGDQFYYFVTARDILGRDGATSNGTLVTVFARMKGKAPRRVRVENHYARDAHSGAETRRLEVVWEAPPGPPPSGYRVYRWASVGQVHQQANGDPEALAVSPVIPHAPGVATLRWVDDGSGAPAVPADLGKTFWYTVRAFRDAAAGRIYSPNSPSAFGVLRDREGPEMASDAGITVAALCATVEHIGSGVVPLGGFDPGIRPGQRWAVMVCDRDDPRVAWAQFIHLDPSAGGAPGAGLSRLPPPPPQAGVTADPPGWSVSPRLAFGTGDRVEHEMAVGAGGGLLVCIAGMADGREAFAVAELGVVGEQQRYLSGFAAGAEDKIESVGGGAHAGVAHDPLDAVTGQPVPVEVGFTAPPSAREWKIYRRVDHGEQTLLAFGDSGGEVTVADLELPPNGALVCYYAQTFDEHGNPSVMQRLGCTRTRSRTPLPVPLLSPVRRAGGGADPGATVEWFCEPHGVDHFEVFVGVESEADVVALDSDEMERAPELREDIDGRRFFGYRTGRVDGGFAGAGDGRFSVAVDVAAGSPLWFLVRAVGAAGEVGGFSNEMQFVWVEPPAPDPEVAWPARPLPPVDLAPLAAGKFAAHFIDAPEQGFTGVGVRIGGLRVADGAPGFSLGEMRIEDGRALRDPTTFDGLLAPAVFLYEIAPGETALPCVLYRFQLPNDLFPDVPRKLVQVTPLIDRLRSKTITPSQGGGPRTGLTDPFVEAFRPPGSDDPDELGIYIKDSQGVVAGAAYAYLLVRFRDNGEIDRTIPIGTVEAGAP